MLNKYQLNYWSKTSYTKNSDLVLILLPYKSKEKKSDFIYNYFALLLYIIYSINISKE